MRLQLGIETGDAALNYLFDPQAKRCRRLPTETSPLDDIYTFETPYIVVARK